MCGLYGYSIMNGEINNFSSIALNSLTHRGPDQWGKWHDELLYMGHRRLSIIDLSENGKQPMIDKDNTVVISVNGEIYNFKQIRKELKIKYQFKSDSDSEVILHGYREWGIDKLLGMIDGMYAIVIYDILNKKVYLIRDRVGIKPLYYSFIDNQLVWGSELKAIIAHYKNKQLPIDNSALYDFLTYLYIPTPKTMFKGVFKLEPAHFIEFDLLSQNLIKKQYWQLEVKENPIKLGEAKKELKHLIKKSVKEQMISDVPLGFFLSGGMDSSVVTASAQTIYKNISAYSIGFDVKEHSEIEFAKLLANNCNIDHNVKILSLDKTKLMFNKLLTWYDEPFGDTSAFPTNIVAEFAKESVTVVLTGDGGDEIFGGYNWYNRFLKLLKYDLSQWNHHRHLVYKCEKNCGINILRKLLKKLDRTMMSDLERYASLLGNMGDGFKEKYKIDLGIDSDYDDLWYFRKYYKPDLPLFTRLQYLDFHTYLPDDILTKVDRATMATSLEARVPLLSKEIIEFSFGIPENIRVLKGDLKGLFKYTFSDLLPKQIIDREKKGFSIPSKAWRNDLYDGYSYPQEKILELFTSQLKTPSYTL